MTERSSASPLSLTASSAVLPRKRESRDRSPRRAWSSSAAKASPGAAGDARFVHSGSYGCAVRGSIIESRRRHSWTASPQTRLGSCASSHWLTRTNGKAFAWRRSRSARPSRSTRRTPLRERVGAGRGLARIDRVTGQAVEQRRNLRRADDGHRHLVWRRVVEGADVGEREREQKHQRREQHQTDRVRRGWCVRDQRCCTPSEVTIASPP
jgi:hypothetical protein